MRESRQGAKQPRSKKRLRDTSLETALPSADRLRFLEKEKARSYRAEGTARERQHLEPQPKARQAGAGGRCPAETGPTPGKWPRVPPPTTYVYTLMNTGLI